MRRPLQLTRLCGTLFLVVGLLAVAACGDDTTGPTNANDLPPAAAASQAQGMVSVVTDLISTSDDIAAANFGNLGMFEVPSAQGSAVPIARADVTVTFNYDAVAGEWTVAASGSDSMGTTFSANYLVQFRDANGDAQIEPGPTTASVSYTAELHISSSFTNPETGSSLSATFDYGADVSMTGLLEGPVHLVGNGAMSGSVSGNDGQNSFDYNLAANWDVDVSVPFGGCPTGSANVRFGSYSATVTYDGTNQASWGVYQGTTLLDSGFESMDCGTLAR